MTEEEAKTKWCPFVRVGGLKGSASEGTSCNRWAREAPLKDEQYRCIGSECMAWRQREDRDFKARADAAYRHDGSRLRPCPGDIVGWCGLAGAPQ